MSVEQGIDKGIDNIFALESKSNSPIDIDKKLLEDIIGTVSQLGNLTQTVDDKGDQETVEKTSEDDDNSEQTNSKTSRELKLLLALSKEANLETNILHKRKSIEGNKPKEKESSPKISLLDTDIKKIPKVANENRNFRYPVTAESELEIDIQENEVKNVGDNSNKTSKRKRDSLSEVNIGGATEENTKRNRKSLSNEMFKPNKDMFCWRCHREGVNVACETCPRSYHQRCLKQTISDVAHWPCPECVSILKAESTQTRSEAMKGMTLEHLCSLLKFAVNRMIQCQGSEPFLHPVSDSDFPDYKKYIVQPMDLTKIEKNIKENLYGSTQAFEADAKWLLHNSIIFNSYQSKLTSSAKNIIRICKQEMAEIENCPSCYLNANTKKGTWFVEVCPKPHLLVWAKLKGFPFWPAKAMCTNAAGMVDVRFFGAHDRAWVHFKDCYLFSEKDPNTFKQKRYDIEKCIEELNIYIKNLQRVYGEFRYAPYKTVLDPNNEFKQLQIFLPKYKIPKKKIKYTLNKVDADKTEIKEDKKKIDIKNTDHSEEKEIDVTKVTDSSNPLEANETPEIRENIPESKKDEMSQKQNGLDIKPNGISSPCKSHYNLSEFNDNDMNMEGYGTDDDTNPEIDLELRKTFIGRKTDDLKNSTMEEEEEEEDEEDNDTQVPSNISVENTFIRGNVRTRGGLSSLGGKIKVLPRRTSDTDTIQKRQSTEEMPHSPQKVSRRNSDQSVKSDSSRMSNISDKINRVDISENMEVTLGNDDVSCISISENVSSNHSESTKSISDHGLDNKRKPVQVDIENAEFTISPSNKLKISDKLIKRLSDGGENITSSPRVEEVKKALVGKKSPTDILIEKFKGVVEREIVDFSQPSTSSNKTKENDDLDTRTPEISTTTEAPEKVTDSVESCANALEETFNSKCISPSSENVVPIEGIIQSSNSPKHTNTEEVGKSIETDAYNDQLHVGNDILSLNEENIDIKHIEENIEDLEENVNDGDSEKIIESDEQKPNTNMNEKESSLKEIPPEQAPKKQTVFIQPSITEFTTSFADKQNNISEKEICNDITNISVENSSNTTTTGTTSNRESSKKPMNSEVESIIQEFEDTEEMDTLENIEIDKNKIFNIIHSSLNAAKLKSTNKNNDSVKENYVPKISESGKKKRKLSADETLDSQAKLVKLVPIETILNKQDDKKKENADSPLLQKSLQGKKMIRKPSSVSSTPVSSLSRQSSVQEILTEEIKSEPETDDDFSESENLEAKKKYLSALNISEKVSDAERKFKANEIRTRSKAEEKREKFKVVDNLTRIIDDVALNYSAINEGKELPPKKPERRRSIGSVQEGEIFVKSFAKIQAPKPKARKSFPVPAYIKSNQQNLSKNDSSSPITTQKKDVPKSTGNIITAKIVSSTSLTSTTPSQKSVDSCSTSRSHVILLPPNQTISYNSSLMNPILNVVSPVISTPTTNSTSQSVPHSLLKAKTTSPNLRASQNYIPQNEAQAESSAKNNAILNDLLNQPVLNRRESGQTETTENIAQTAATDTATDTSQEDEFSVLNSLLPESVSRAVSDLLLRPPPRLKPRPPGMLSTTFDEGVPSSAGDVTTKINSVAHRMGDYFRGMLIETLEDLGKSSSPEAKITSLQLEIESLKHRHTVEISEIRKNVCTILKDIQKSIVEDRERIIDDTRTACEAEAIKRVELAKSKQWCANCSKEAQFYCCWNTSYCDYPCQQKHWPQHLGKCTQNVEKLNNTVTAPNRPTGQQLILRPAVPPKPGMGRILAKPTKVYMNRNAGPPKTFKALSTTGNHLTVIETTPGNYELVGNGPIAVTGKFLATTSNIFHSKFKTSNVMTMTSPSTSGTSDQRNVQKTTPISESTKSTTPNTHSTTLPVTTMLDDESD